MRRMNKKGAVWYAIMFIVLGVVALGAAGYVVKDKFFSSGGNSSDEVTGAWANKNVYYDINIKDKYTNDALNVSLEIFEDEPSSCWENLRKDSCEEDAKTTGSVVSGTDRITDLTPGSYYVSARATDYYPMYFMMTIPSEGEESELASEYNQAPDALNLRMKKVGALTIENESMSFTTNATSKEKSRFMSFQVDENECFIMGKMSVTEDQNSLSEYDTNEVSYEGVKIFKIKLNDKWTEVVSEGDNGDFDSATIGQKETFDLSNDLIEICDEGLLSFTYYIKANIDVSADAIGDQLLSNETIAHVVLKDIIGNAQTTSILSATHA